MHVSVLRNLTHQTTAYGNEPAADYREPASDKGEAAADYRKRTASMGAPDSQHKSR